MSMFKRPPLGGTREINVMAVDHRLQTQIF